MGYRFGEVFARWAAFTTAWLQGCACCLYCHPVVPVSLYSGDSNNRNRQLLQHIQQLRLSTNSSRRTAAGLCSELFGMWFVVVMALGGVANHVLNPSAGRGMGYLAMAVQFG